MAALNKQFDKTSYEDFLNLPADARAEYINGEIIMQAAPSTDHGDIVDNLFVELRAHFKNKNCKSHSNVKDVRMKDKYKEYAHVLPDIFVICEKGTITKKFFEKPTMIIEVLSPSNEYADLITKKSFMSLIKLMNIGLYPQQKEELFSTF